MTHFGENTEFIEDDPANLMLPSDSTKTVSILNYGPPKFQSYENFITQSPDSQSPDLQNPDPQSPDTKAHIPKAQILEAQIPKAQINPRKNTGIHFNTKSNKIDSIKY